MKKHKKKKKEVERKSSDTTDVAVFTSPIGLVRCTFSKKGRLTSCQPLSDDDWPLQGDSILKDREKHPSLAEAFWNGKSIPSKYEPKLPENEDVPKFWSELMKVPRGKHLTYEEFATQLNLAPTEAKNVEQYLLKNPFCLIVPCHRIVGGNGDIGSYRWEQQKKRAMLDYEGFSAEK